MRLADPSAGAVLPPLVLNGKPTPGAANWSRWGPRGQSRPANQFLLGWARDFIAVLAPAGAGG